MGEITMLALNCAHQLLLKVYNTAQVQLHASKSITAATRYPP